MPVRNKCRKSEQTPQIFDQIKYLKGHRNYKIKLQVKIYKLIKINLFSNSVNHAICNIFLDLQKYFSYISAIKLRECQTSKTKSKYVFNI